MQPVKIYQRNYGIDLLRIVSMFFICVLHVLGHGGILQSTVFLSINYYIGWFLEISAYCAVDCYALISGFVGLNSKYKVSRILYLWLQVFFYSTVNTAILAFFKPSAVSGTVIFHSFLPITFNAYWYFTCYFATFLLSPIFNSAIQNVPKTILNWSLMIFIVFVSIFSLVNPFLFSLSGGYTPLWLMLLYLIGGYIKYFQPLKEVEAWKLIVIWISAILLTWLFKLVIELFASKNVKTKVRADLFISYISPTIIVVAVALLELFSRISFQKQPKIIEWFSSLSFGVYLIHVHYFIWSYILPMRFKTIAKFHPILLILVVIGISLAIYITCSIIDYFRLLLFNILRIRPLLEKLELKIHKNTNEDVTLNLEEKSENSNENVLLDSEEKSE
jgi:surface polysaccharide O-acyltransferase-like enzyme